MFGRNPRIALIATAGLSLAGIVSFGHTPAAHAAALNHCNTAYNQSFGAIYRATVPEDASYGTGQLFAMYCNMQKGNVSSGVKALQSALNSCYSAGLVLDGRYGTGTEAAVKKAQHLGGVTADGIYGPQTLTHMKFVIHQGSSSWCGYPPVSFG